MADPIRLYAEFTDDLGTDYRVNIHDSNFTMNNVVRQIQVERDVVVHVFTGTYVQQDFTALSGRLMELYQALSTGRVETM